MKMKELPPSPLYAQSNNTLVLETLAQTANKIKEELGQNLYV